MTDGRRRREIKETLDLGLGFVGFFALAFLVITFVTEITGGDALIWSGVTIFLLVVVGSLWLLRRRLLARFDEHQELQSADRARYE